MDDNRFFSEVKVVGDALIESLKLYGIKNDINPREMTNILTGIVMSWVSVEYEIEIGELMDRWMELLKSLIKEKGENEYVQDHGID